MVAEDFGAGATVIGVEAMVSSVVVTVAAAVLGSRLAEELGAGVMVAAAVVDPRVVVAPGAVAGGSGSQPQQKQTATRRTALMPLPAYGVGSGLQPAWRYQTPADSWSTETRR